MRNRRRRDGLLGGQPVFLGNGTQRLEVVDRQPARALELAADLDAGRGPFDVAGLVVELGRQASANLDAVDPLDEVQEPVPAVVVAIGADAQADIALQLDRVPDTRSLQLP